MTTRDTVFADALWAPSNRLLRDGALALAGSALIGLSAHVALPMWPVPVTMQTFAVLLIGLAYGPRLAAVTVAAYLLEGLVGAPVFTGGPATLVGPTGGYLMGFLPAAVLAGALASRGWSRTPLRVAAAMLAGSLTIYVFGAAWLAGFVGPSKAVALGVAPFLVGDAIKAALAAALAPVAWRWLGRSA
ncbi:biotin transporter BioY [Alsobacter soli]|uniref:Biotin transporter n=1 Tax=Alsobacter soli TaxID=2109933 RepID=A0A2T1HVE6_9HYPH|nr:biotin transporter BioY [Alsobacter soli]PSC05598.1 biotin transporter BioY [Alsobacter soli]